MTRGKFVPNKSKKKSRSLPWPPDSRAEKKGKKKKTNSSSNARAHFGPPPTNPSPGEKRGGGEGNKGPNRFQNLFPVFFGKRKKEKKGGLFSSAVMISAFLRASGKDQSSDVLSHIPSTPARREKGRGRHGRRDRNTSPRHLSHAW